MGITKENHPAYSLTVIAQTVCCRYFFDHSAVILLHVSPVSRNKDTMIVGGIEFARNLLI
jgi:hypothetical protein